MTPAERIAAAIGYRRPIDRMLGESISMTRAFHQAGAILDALCPRGERVVLDRTGDTDRLIRQRLVKLGPLGVQNNERVPLWVDSPEGNE